MKEAAVGKSLCEVLVNKPWNVHGQNEFWATVFKMGPAIPPAGLDLAQSLALIAIEALLQALSQRFIHGL